MRKILLAAAATCALAAPALADDVGVRVGPVGAGVTVGEGNHDYDMTGSGKRP
jgi:opacity protein-like surface antigen